MEEETPKPLQNRNERLMRFFEYVDDQIANRSEGGVRVKGCKAMGWWCPLWEIDTFRDSYNEQYRKSEVKHSLGRALYDVLTYAREKTGKENPTLLDLGSGDGFICFEATISGFKAVGVEVDDAAHQRALEYQKDLEDQGIIARNMVTLKKGVYYLKEYWDTIQEGWKKEYPTVEERILYLGERDRPNDTAGINQRYEDKMAEFRKGTGALEDYLDSERKLNVDVIFWYPSDSMAGASKEQWLGILKPDTIFILTKNNFQTDELRNRGFFDKDNYRLLKEDSDFVVYQRK